MKTKNIEYIRYILAIEPEESLATFRLILMALLWSIQTQKEKTRKKKAKQLIK